MACSGVSVRPRRDADSTIRSLCRAELGQQNQVPVFLSTSFLQRVSIPDGVPDGLMIYHAGSSGSLWSRAALRNNVNSGEYVRLPQGSPLLWRTRPAPGRERRELNLFARSCVMLEH